MVWSVLGQAHADAIAELNASASDRIVAVVGGALLDQALRRAIETRLRETTLSEQLFKVTGPLGNTKPKIQMAYALYMIEKPMMNSMEGLADIRNEFAHNLSVGFKSDIKRMKDGLELLVLHKVFSHYPDPMKRQAPWLEVEQVTDARSKFIVNLKLCLSHLMLDSSRHVLWNTFPVFYPGSAPKPFFGDLELAQIPPPHKGT